MNKNKNLKSKYQMSHYLTCFASFKRDDPVCRLYCSLSIKCIIEKDINAKVAMFEDYLLDESVSAKLQ